MNLDSKYDPKKVEDGIYRLWEESGYFNPDKLPGKRKKKFTIIMPPPNANGALHIGHALFVTLQDLMIRYHRMKDDKTLWLPGADHAGFETQVVFDKKLEKEGRNRFEIPREELYKEIWDFTQKNKTVMENQLRKLGASCDWSREKFTLDKDIVDAVYDTFQKLYEDDLVYRGKRVVNWCPKHQTALSDLEVKYVEREDPLYYIKYGPLTLATVRPETKFGDTALAVNPKDKRYQKYIGKEIEAQGIMGLLRFRVISDDAVDPNFGTGVVKVTPAHDLTDFEIWQRHKDEIPGPIGIIDERGRLTGETGPFSGMKVSEAREKVAEKMKEIGILEKIENYKHNVGTCYKCGNVLEPLLKPQWFIKMTEKPKSGGDSLRDTAVKAVKSGKIKFIPKRFEKIFFHWMKNLRDWNISRQIVWGIRIPAWFCDNCKEIIIYKNNLGECPKCHSQNIKQDSDVFDTWFSSGQWPFATLGYPKSKDFKEFYPTSVMETGWDILFFWVARMIMLGIYRTEKVPFETIYLHGLVRDKDRQKMSKSKGNVIDPLGVAEIYGTDAVRMSLIVGTTAGNDPIISEDKIRGYRNFATKIWNTARFVLMNYDEKFEKTKPAFNKSDKRILKDLEAIKNKVTKEIDSFRFHQAGLTIYHYLWHTFADKIIEASKPRFRSEDIKERAAAFQLNLEILSSCLKLLHPFMPFITEEIYQKLPLSKKENLLMVAQW